MSLLKAWMEDNAELFRYSGELGCMREEAERILLSGRFALFLSPLMHTLFPESQIVAVDDDEKELEEAKKDDERLETVNASFHEYSGTGFDAALSLLVSSFLGGRELVSYLFSLHDALKEGGNLNISFLSDDKAYSEMKEETLWYDDARTVMIKRYRPEDFLRALNMVGFSIRAIESDALPELGTIVTVHAIRG